MSRPNLLATAISRNSSTTDQRSVICPVASWPSWDNPLHCAACRANHGTKTDSTMASRPNEGNRGECDEVPASA